MLSSQEINKIEKKALEQRKIHDLGDESPIGIKIFGYIENIFDSYILLYPLRTKKIAGFTRKQGDVIQIYVNTSFNINYQAFAAAHEIYHLIGLKETSKDNFIVCNEHDISESIDDKSIDIEEVKANYFAAAFLMPKRVIEDRFSSIKGKKYNEEDIIIKIIELQYEYEIPFKTILKRLKELKIICYDEYEKYNIYEKNIFQFHKMLDDEVIKHINELESPNMRKYHSLNIPKLAFDVYRNNIISVSKFESILNKYGKNLDDFNIIKTDNIPISIDFSNFGTGDEEYDNDQ
ncbi:MAG TPA: hypothetical protein DIV40_06630 [Clostridiales bacterium]|jgi:Zn-dependent peptidase ImmA (M78 family)|nr:hypothetical protein [Clostridiales bacterium]